MRLLALVPIMLFCSSNVQAGEWKQVFDDYNLKVFSGTVKVSRDKGGGKQVELLATWDTADFTIPNPKGIEAMSIKATVTIFCDRRVGGTYGIRGAAYSQLGMQGETLIADKFMGYEDIVPETVWYSLREKYCSGWAMKLLPDKVKGWLF